MLQAATHTTFQMKSGSDQTDSKLPRVSVQERLPALITGEPNKGVGTYAMNHHSDSPRKARSASSWKSVRFNNNVDIRFIPGPGMEWSVWITPQKPSVPKPQKLASNTFRDDEGVDVAAANRRLRKLGGLFHFNRSEPRGSS
eukprot:gnl/TRDRNA2_/TRDRNA2_76014_c0_seq1.p1 gnl/TRDRNA2_/TRDRNA2_76014_c0~~gnl/TRDRNA2_/TRDRNA2_76014_c0_seq1.p1  ORF type:complete len:142 (+),score=10.21 gnl/TRDRNA2_/TRDRNA2_76014_c0_seq1:66-491(+)